MNIESLEFIYQEGENNPGEIKMYAISTCAFCRKAIRFLKENSICFSYVYMDELDREVKHQVKVELREKFKKEIGYPFVVIDDEQIIVGYTEDEYKKTFLK